MARFSHAPARTFNEPTSFESALSEVYDAIGRLKVQHKKDLEVLRGEHDSMQESSHQRHASTKRANSGASSPPRRISMQSHDSKLSSVSRISGWRISEHSYSGYLPPLPDDIDSAAVEDKEEADASVPEDVVSGSKQISCLSRMISEATGSPPYGSEANDKAEASNNTVGEFFVDLDNNEISDADTSRELDANGSANFMVRGSEAALTQSVMMGLQTYQATDRHFRIKKPWCDNPEFNNVTVRSLKRGRTQARLDSLTVQKITSEKRNISADMLAQLDAENSRCSRAVMMNPESRTRSTWMSLCLCFLVYDLIMVPVDLSFDLERDDIKLFLMQLLSAIFWSIDMGLTFCTAVMTPTHLEIRMKKVAWKYVSTWFFLDLFLVLQDWVEVLISTPGMSAVALVRGIRLVRFMRLLRVLRILRVLRFKPFLKKLVFELGLTTQKFDVYRGWVSLTLAFLIGTHVVTCFWHGVGALLDDGWVKRNHLEKDTVIRRYLISLQWTLSRLQGIMVPYGFQIEADMEIVMDCFLIFFSLMAAAVYVGQVTVVSISRLSSKAYALKRLANDYAQRHKVTPPLKQKIMKTILAGHIGGAGEVQESESKLLAELPTTLQEDLIFEARVPMLTEKQFFLDALVVNPRVIRHISNRAMTSVVVVGDEVVFDEGEACDRMLFVMMGSLWYRHYRDLYVQRGSGRFSWKKHDKTNGDDDTSDHCQKGAAISEPVLWTTWDHTGQLVAEDEAMLVALDSNDFGTVIVQHHEAHVHAVKYAKHFVWNLKRVRPQTDPGEKAELCDLIDFPHLTLEQLDEELFDGTEADHFIFISHYKIESGTEATLIRDLLEPILKLDVDNLANELQTPIFIDSEDLSDLSELRTHVQNSFCLVLLLTPGLLSRPWCLLEIVWACAHKVNVVPVEIQRPGFKYRFPDEDFYYRLQAGKFLSQDAMAVLKGEEIRLSEVEAAIRQVFQKIALPFSPHKSKKVRNAELEDILKRCNDGNDGRDYQSKFEGHGPSRVSRVTGALSDKFPRKSTSMAPTDFENTSDASKDAD